MIFYLLIADDIGSLGNVPQIQKYNTFRVISPVSKVQNNTTLLKEIAALALMILFINDDK